MNMSSEPDDLPGGSSEGTSYFQPTFGKDTGAGEPQPEGELVEARIPAGSALLVVKRGPNVGSQFLLDKGTVSVGRHPDSDIFLDDTTVSRHHVEFHRRGTQFLLRDVGSLNGTYVNRHPTDQTELSHGDEVQIGKFRLVFLTGQ
ncbi:FHA domain-containing protein [Haloechinothrix halophila]|uniref:FHA domain-containing protein n=1 Tax=Haloechinothrix halophila TaxID=1069073 RepID=UPI000421BA26